jgi:hypothetical protein
VDSKVKEMHWIRRGVCAITLSKEFPWIGYSWKWEVAYGLLDRPIWRNEMPIGLSKLLWQGFTSTSLDINIALKFRGTVLFKMSTWNLIPSMTEVSAFHYDQEFILNPSQEFNLGHRRWEQKIKWCIISVKGEELPQASPCLENRSYQISDRLTPFRRSSGGLITFAIQSKA